MGAAAGGPPQSAAAPSPFPPIADYAFLSNGHTGALIAPDGASTGCAYPGSTRRLYSAASSTSRRLVPAWPVRDRVTERPAV